MMRTTINLPDDVYELARSQARASDTSLGAALAALVRQALRPPAAIDSRGAFPCFVLPAGSEPITLERTLEVEDEA